MKPYLLFFSFLFLSFSFTAQNNKQKNLSEFANTIAGKSESEFEQAKSIINWFAKNFKWTYTDYKKRTVSQILERKGGNCNELASVSMAIMKEKGIKFRRVREINLHVNTPRRQNDAEKKVAESGNRMSVFGQRHNDHVWIEIYDSKTQTWHPADPTSGVVGKKAWLTSRFGFDFENRFSLNPSSKDMIAPFAIFALDAKWKVTENRTEYYAIREFNSLYNGKLSELPSWKDWEKGVQSLSKKAFQAFEGTINLHNHTEEIKKLWEVYFKLKKEYEK